MTDVTTDTWDVDAKDFPVDGSREDQASFLLHYAILAPSSHNTQPWLFRIGDSRIDLSADLSRWLRIADSDQRELYLSVGCALENLLVAAEHFGFAPSVEYQPNARNPALVARVDLRELQKRATPSRPPSLFEAITRRHTNHREYDGRPVPETVRTELEALASEPGIGIFFIDDSTVLRHVDELTIQADAVQFADPRWRRELGHWLGEGVFGTSWLMSKASRFAVSRLNLSRSVSRKDHELLESASLMGLVAVDHVDGESRIRAGQVFERLFLAATDAGLALQPMNQILQVPDVRDAFEALLPPEWGTPQITFRLGHAEPEDHTPRRPLEAVVRADGSVSKVEEYRRAPA